MLLTQEGRPFVGENPPLLFQSFIACYPECPEDALTAIDQHHDMVCA
jgi:hypothetical protein